MGQETDNETKLRHLRDRYSAAPSMLECQPCCSTFFVFLTFLLISLLLQLSTVHRDSLHQMACEVDRDLHGYCAETRHALSLPSNDDSDDFDFEVKSSGPRLQVWVAAQWLHESYCCCLCISILCAAVICS